jgi:hypothetical protein
MSGEQAVHEKLRIDVAGFPVEWDIDSGQCFWSGASVIVMWVDSSMVGLMPGFQKMVGTDRFNLALQSEGRAGWAAACEEIFMTERGVATARNSTGGASRCISTAPSRSIWCRWRLPVLSARDCLMRPSSPCN